MNKPLKIIIAIIVIVFGGIIAFNLFKAFMIKRFFAHYEPPAITVSSVTAIKKPWISRMPAVGNFVAINGVEVNSQAAGNVVKIHFDSGEYVEANSPLIDIDDSIDNATLKFNQAQLSLKDINYKRQVDLGKRGAASVSTVDEAKANLEQAEANVEKTQAAIKQKHISAPFAGRLGIRLINLGQYIKPGDTAIVALQSLDPLFLQFYLPEQQLTKLSVNQPIRFRVEAFKDKLFVGKVSAINSKVDPNTHNIMVQAILPNCPTQALINPKSVGLVKESLDKDTGLPIIICDSALNSKNHVTDFAFIPGMFASIAVEQPAQEEVVILPSTAISYSLYGNAVYLIEEDKNGAKDEKGEVKHFVKRVFVSTGEQQGNYTVIKKGIEPGQQVVSAGELKLQNGDRIVINNTVPLNTTPQMNTLGH